MLVSKTIPPKTFLPLSHVVFVSHTKCQLHDHISWSPLLLTYKHTYHPSNTKPDPQFLILDFELVYFKTFCILGYYLNSLFSFDK